MSELELTSGQIAELRRVMGLQPGDYLDAAALVAFIEAGRIVDDAAAGLDGSGDDSQ